MRYVAPELVVGVLSALPYSLVLQRRLLSPPQTEELLNGVEHPVNGDAGAALCGASPTALFQAAAGRHDAVAYAATTLLGCTFGFKESSFVVASLLLHVLNTVLLYKFCCKFASGRRNASERVISTAAMFASIVFAVHPLRSDVVCGPSNLAYSLTLCLGLCSTITFLSTFRTRSLLKACVFAILSAASYALASMATPLIAPLPVVYVLGVLGGYQRSQPLLSNTESAILNGCVAVSFLTAIGVVGRYTLLPLLPSDAAQLASGITAQRVELLVYTFHRLLLSHIYPARVDLRDVQDKLAAESVDTSILVSLAIQLALFVWCGLHVLFALLQRKGPKAASITYFALLAMYFPSLLGGDGGDTQSADRATYLPACIFSVIFTISFIDTVVLPSVTARSGTDVVMLVRDDEKSRRHSSSDKTEDSTTMLHCRRRLFSRIKKMSWALVVLLLVTTYFTTQMRFTADVSKPVESAIVRPNLDLLGSDTEAGNALVIDSSESVPNTTVQDPVRDEQEEPEEVVIAAAETVEEAATKVEAVDADSSLPDVQVEDEDEKAELVEEPEAAADGGEADELVVVVESEPSQEDLQQLSAPPVALLEDCGCNQEEVEVEQAEAEAQPEVETAPAENEAAREEEEPEHTAVVAVEVEAADGELVVTPELTQDGEEQPAAVEEEAEPEAEAEEASEAATAEEQDASAVALLDEQTVVAVDEQEDGQEDAVDQEPSDDSQVPEVEEQHEEDDRVVEPVDAEPAEEEARLEEPQEAQDEQQQAEEEVVQQVDAEVADAAEQVENSNTEIEEVHEEAEEVPEQAVEEQQAEAVDESAEAAAVAEEQTEVEEEEPLEQQQVQQGEAEEETEEETDAAEAVVDEAPAAEVLEVATGSADDEQPDTASEPDLAAEPAADDPEAVLDGEAN